MSQRKLILFLATCCLIQMISFTNAGPTEENRIAKLRTSSFRRSSSNIPTENLPDTDLSKNEVQSKISIDDSNKGLETEKTENVQKSENHAHLEKSRSRKPRRKLSRSSSRKHSVPQEYTKADRLEWRERAKNQIRDLIRDANANKAVTKFILNGKDLLMNKVASDVIRNQVRMIMDTLTNEEAREIIDTLGYEIAQALTKENAPDTANHVFAKCLEYISDRELPGRYQQEFKDIGEFINNKNIVNMADFAAKGFTEFVRREDSPTVVNNMLVNLERLLYPSLSGLLQLATK